MSRFTWILAGLIAVCTILLLSYEYLIVETKPIRELEIIVQNHTIYVNNTVYVVVESSKEEEHQDESESWSEETPEQPTSPPATTQSYVQPYLDLLSISASDEDVSAQWQDDDGKLRYVTLMYQPTTVDDDLNCIRRFVGSIHFFEKELMKTTIFGYEVPEDFVQEIRTFSFVRFINIGPDRLQTREEAHAYVMDVSQNLYERFIFVNASQRIQLTKEGLADRIASEHSAGKISVLAPDAIGDAYGFIRGVGEGVSLNFTDYFEINEKKNDEHGRCSLLRNLSSPFRIKHVFSHHNENFLKKEARHNADDRLVCLSIATYSGSNPDVSVDEFSLMSKVMSSFMTSTVEDDTPTSRYRFALYLGLQRDKFYDNPAKFEELKAKIIQLTQPRAFSLRIFYTPLNAPAMDITYKWNAVIDQSYRDMCDYIYQYSDDTIFVTPWANSFIRYLEADSNFGIVGATDNNHQNLMTLSFSHRNHISILGSYWPSHLKNWYSDNWAQLVYGQRYTRHFRDVQMQNTQQQGQRYPSCDHGALYDRLMREESRPRIVEWLKKQPQSYDIRQKLDYFENRHAEGEKKR